MELFFHLSQKLLVFLLITARVKLNISICHGCKTAVLFFIFKRKFTESKKLIVNSGEYVTDLKELEMDKAFTPLIETIEGM